MSLSDVLQLHQPAFVSLLYITGHLQRSFSGSMAFSVWQIQKSQKYTQILHQVKAQSHICNGYCLLLSLYLQYHFPLFVCNEVKSQ